ncbi:hypothetical protein ANCCEY_14017 [Ancylostoma ceylanicum]|uniref:Uncharacterized protein n=1 Tax=Ancylostoma ceylanicum TaxID=53326 RepID=A0A0D6LAU7_9BILA|nr:hypothetical protein ANCCEY_14017 [Ancylostoma ceylanicum]
MSNTSQADNSPPPSLFLHQDEEARNERQPPNLGIALTRVEPAENYLGPLNHSCDCCGTLYFNNEAKRINGRYNRCCNFGDITLHYFSDFPESFISL